MSIVFVEGSDPLITKMFKAQGWKITTEILLADLVCLEGGSDVSPEIYGENNYASHSKSSRDIATFGLISIADLMHIPVVGICRGSQALCVARGGKLCQHVSGHSRTHSMDFRGASYTVSSTHHQMCIPKDGTYTDVGYASDGVTEVVIYNKGGGISYQSHPEYLTKNDECWILFFDLIKEQFNLD